MDDGAGVGSRATIRASAAGAEIRSVRMRAQCCFSPAPASSSSALRVGDATVTSWRWLR